MSQYVLSAVLVPAVGLSASKSLDCHVVLFDYVPL